MLTNFWNAPREFIPRLIFFTAIIFLLASASAACRAQTKGRAGQNIVGGGCDGCERMYDNMPQQLSGQTAIASAAEPGERMEVSGIIFQADGRTPSPNVILYVYHTDAKGLYSPAPGATGGARINGHLRGWMKTNDRGEYRFTSIRPAPYPNRAVPAHIHATVKEPDKNEYYIDEYLFDDDPALTREPQPRTEDRGGSGIIHLAKNSEGVWIGKRNIVLGLNIPNYR
jgi:protocatechuate 3,4-dioxygenase beta subunit